MLDIPFDIIRCAWPRPVVHDGERWSSAPAWDAPAMPHTPLPHWEMIDGRPCWMIDWREFFRVGVKHPWNSVCGEMCGFHVVFRIRARAAGTLVIWADDGCIIRRDGGDVHSDRGAHPLTRCDVAVHAGEEFDVAQWQLHHDWIWAARIERAPEYDAPSADTLLAYGGPVARRLEHADGPPLKLYVNGRTPQCTTLALYSMILNGYSPSKVLLYGEHQWSAEARQWFATAAPFAEIVSTDEIALAARNAGGEALEALARAYWYVMKVCIALLHPPSTFCMMDDDIFVLASVAEAVAHLGQSELVFAPDTDHGAAYLSVWGSIFGLRAPLPTHRMNTGLLWMRQVHDARRIGGLLLRGAGAVGRGAWVWEQGFVAALFAGGAVHQLPSQRYLCPLWDGLPGGVLGYDYAGNPSEFIAVHFGGLLEKPTDAVALHLAPQILGRARAEP